MMIHATVVMFIAPNAGDSFGLLAGVLANLVGTALLHVDRRLEGIEDKLQAIGAVNDPSQTE